MKSPGSTRKTILFSGHDFRFLRPFVSHCRDSPGYRVLIDEHEGHDISDPERCRELLRSADIIFCEWCLGNAVWFSRHKSPHQRLVIRLHLQEMRLPYPDQVEWDNVDALILICPQNHELIRRRYPFLKSKTHLVYNPIDCAQLAQPKLPGAEFNLGIMGICPKRKEPHLAVEILDRLKQLDGRFTLFIKGKHPRDCDWLWRRLDERAYYEKFYGDIERSADADSVIFEGYADDVPLWFSKIGFILSTSEFEGSHQSVAEGMASGAIPVIRSWAGADRLYPPRFVFSTIDEAVDLVTNVRHRESYEREMEAVQGYASSMFQQDRIIEQIDRLVSAAVSGCESSLDSVGLVSPRKRNGPR